MEILDLYSENFWLQIIAVLTIGLLVGSFLNVVILRLPIMMFRSWKKECQEVDQLPDHPALKDLDKPFNLVTPNSHCRNCGTPIKSWQNIPVISYLMLKGKCGECGTAIGIRYPAVELVSGLMSLALIAIYPWGWPLAAMLVFTWLLIAMSVIDIDYQILPDQLTLGLLWLGLLCNLNGWFVDIESAVIGAVVGYMSLWSVYWVFKLLTGKEGMGFGDFKLLAALGAWFGYQKLLLIILLSSAVGAVVGIAGILLLGRDKQLPIPFGPYLAAAGWIAAMWGDDIMYWYLGSF